MATLIPEVNMSEFKRLNASQIRSLKSCELYADGVYVCTVIVPSTDYIRVQTEYNAELSNSVGGKNLEEVVVHAAV